MELNPTCVLYQPRTVKQNVKDVYKVEGQRSSIMSYNFSSFSLCSYHSPYWCLRCIPQVLHFDFSRDLESRALLFRISIYFKIHNHGITTHTIYIKFYVSCAWWTESLALIVKCLGYGSLKGHRQCNMYAGCNPINFAINT